MERMHNTGIVRMIDDLGRICVPKEIRKALYIKEGDPLELFIVDNGIAFFPYDPVYGHEKRIEKVVDGIYSDPSIEPAKRAEILKKIKEIEKLIETK